MNRIALTALALALPWLPFGVSLGATPAEAGDLKVTVTGVPSDAGALMIGLYDNQASFDSAIANSTKVGLLKDNGRLVGVTMRARTGSQSIGFTQLAAGRYAIIVFHDQNDNGLLDEDLIGIPTEAYGFSNNATGLFSAPSFDASAVTVNKDTAISIALQVPQAQTQAARPSK